MQWEKCGLLWTPPEGSTWAKTHATIPVVQSVGDGAWHVYLGIRDAENRAHIGRITVDASSTPVFRRFDPLPVLSLGVPGTFDDRGMMPSWLVDDGGALKLYYIGWNVPTTVPYRLSIGLAVSDDRGATFRRFAAGPIMDRSPAEPYFVTTPCVLKEGDRWRMWYSSCTGWRQILRRWEPSYDVKYAESSDGVTWTASGICCIDAGAEGNWPVARPCVFRHGNDYRMLYSYRSISHYRSHPQHAYRLGYAESTDGVQWRRMDDRVGIERSDNGWDAEMMAYGYVHRQGDQTYLLYNGNGFGRSGVGVARLISAD